jgi:hypothetical protein
MANIRTFNINGRLEIITTCRLSLIQEILDFYHERLRRLLEFSSCESKAYYTSGCSYCSYGYSSSHALPNGLCSQTIIGGLYRNQLRLSIHNPPKNAKDVWHHSANSLLKEISDLFGGINTLGGHEDCAPMPHFKKFEEQIRADRRWKNVLQPHHKEHLAAQREKMGLLASPNTK